MKRRNILRALAGACLLCLAGCGIDDFIYLYPVIQYKNFPYPSEDGDGDPSANYFSFKTSDEKNDDYNAEYFKGFEILYKIYNNNSTRSSDASAISTYNTNNPTSIYTYLTGTKGYQRMGAEARVGAFPLVAGSDTNRWVSARLFAQGAYTADFTVAGVSFGHPLRTLNEGATTESFDFDEIDTDDTDVVYSTSGEDDRWYVQAYVLAYGYDSSYKAIYSEAFCLGTVTVNE